LTQGLMTMKKLSSLLLVAFASTQFACVVPAGGSGGGGGGGGETRVDAGAVASGCTSDVDCSTRGEICLNDECVAGCRADRDCELGEVCTKEGRDNHGICGEAPDTGCATDADCNEGQMCQPDGSCISPDYRECAEEADCVAGSNCFRVNEEGLMVCLRQCTQSSQCRTTETCTQDIACIPNYCGSAQDLGECPEAGCNGAFGASCDGHGTDDGFCAERTNANGNFGICHAGAADAACTPLGDDCAVGERCQHFGWLDATGYCAEEGEGQAMDDCGHGMMVDYDADDCADGLLCVPISQGQRSCVPYCNTSGGDTCPQGTECQGVAALFGGQNGPDPALADSPWGLCAPPQQ
jgi:hypothetical protein